jgi:xylulokinase
MGTNYVLGIDVGTTGVKVALFDVSSGKIVAISYKTYELLSPRVGYVELDPEIWWHKSLEAIKELLSKLEDVKEKIVAVGLSGQLNSTTFLDESGNPVYPSIIWMDTRSETQIKKVAEIINAEEFNRITGLRFSPFYAIFKVLWFKEHLPKVLKKTKVVLQAKDYISFKLTGEQVIDTSLASASGLLNLTTKKYAREELLNKLDFPTEILPKLVSPTDIVGTVTDKASKETGLPSGTPIVAGSGDVFTNAIASGVVEPGDAYCKIATASDVIVCSEKLINDKDLRFVNYLHIVPNRYLIVGGNDSGICYRWFRNSFCHIERDIGILVNKDPYLIMDEEAETEEPGSKGLIFLPYITGVRSPIWNSYARGAFIGITLTHDKRSFIRAILEGIAYNVRHRIDVLEHELNVPISNISFVGGGAKSQLFRQIVADVLKMPINLLGITDFECIGASILAGVGAGIYENLRNAINKVVKIEEVVNPRKETFDTYDKLYMLFLKTYPLLKSIFEELAKFKD